MGLLSGRMPASRTPELRPRELVGALRRVGITEARASAGGDLFSQPVLVVGCNKVYGQDGSLLATFRSAESNPSFFRRAFLGAPRVFDIVDVRDHTVLMVEERGSKFKAIAADGSDIGMVLTGHGWRRRHIFQLDGETIGSLRGAGGWAYSVRDPQDVEVGRITQIPASLIRWRVECNVIEIDNGMPSTMRALMPSASEAVSYLNDWWG
jgi:hypothetical protein